MNVTGEYTGSVRSGQEQWTAERPCSYAEPAISPQRRCAGSPWTAGSADSLMRAPSAVTGLSRGLASTGVPDVSIGVFVAPPFGATFVSHAAIGSSASGHKSG